jgi:hypothetical protein
MGHIKSYALNEDSEFVMKESKSLNLLAGIILFIVGVFVLFNIYTDYHADQIIIYKKMLLLSLFPAVFFLWKGLKNNALLTINKTGIYRCDELLTTWDNFINAAINEEPIAGSISDNFVLSVYFCVDGKDGCFKRMMRLPNTRDQSEEEIMEAIWFFSGRGKQ